MVEIGSLSNCGFDLLFEAFSQAFADYEIQPNRKELQEMLNRRGFVPELSFGAFDNDRLISFTFNGIGTFGGIKTAYDTGTGTFKEYRGKGLASRVFNHSIPYLVSSGVDQYLLEVLQHNSSAVSVYKKQGFVVTREFNYFIQEMKYIKPLERKTPLNYTIDEITLADLNNVDSWWDFPSSWQNSFEAINRKPDVFVVVGAKFGSELVGYGILEPSTGDITQIAVEIGHRRLGVGSALLNDLCGRNKFSSIKLINSEISCNSITSLMESNGIPIRGKQFEMIKELK